MKRSIFTQKIYSYLLDTYQWYLQTPERSLDQAYQAALLIKAMEDEYFNGKKIAPESANYGYSSMAYFESELKKYLKTARMRLVEFNLSRSFVNEANNQTITKISRSDTTNPNKVSFAIEARNKSYLVLEKLRFIDEVLARYKTEEVYSSSLVPVNRTTTDALQQFDSTNPTNPSKPAGNNLDNDSDSENEEKSVLPRSLIYTINRIKTELDPNSEREIIKNFRGSQKKTVVSIRIVLLLIIVPLLTYQISKNFIVGPIVDGFFRKSNDVAIFINLDLEEEALTELQKFEQKLRFQNLISETPKFSQPEIKEKVKEKAEEIAEEYREESANAVKNVFADLLSLAAFGWIAFVSKREIAVLKSFMGDIVYGLSDSAKAFVIILFTDIFVGFHSPHGWEVLLSGVSRHFGLPENHDFIFLFIATFPVILDTVFKYWIFRSLSRISPSAVATLRNMNE